jgi:hypothetical protein
MLIVRKKETQRMKESNKKNSFAKQNERVGPKFGEGTGTHIKGPWPMASRSKPVLSLSFPHAHAHAHQTKFGSLDANPILAARDPGNAATWVNPNRLGTQVLL